jgi:hypothetical protein
MLLMEVRAAPFSLSFFSIPRQNKQNVCQDRLRTKQNGRKAHAKMGFFCNVSKRTQREQKASVLPQWHYSAQSFCEPNLPTHSKSGAKVDYLLSSSQTDSIGWLAGSRVKTIVCN